MTPPTKQQQLTSGLARREQLKARLSRFEAFLSNLSSQPDSRIQLESRLEAIKDVWSDFDNIQSNIEALDTSTDSTIDQEERTVFDDRYFHAIATAKAHIQSYEPKTNASLGPSPQSCNSQTSVRLPQLNLPTFNGSYDQWNQFRDTFDALINQNTTLSKVQRFYYLQSSLKDVASQVIHSLQLTEQNYDLAWQLLTERYENKRAIVQAHIKGIFDLQPITKESHASLRTFLDTFQKHFRSLEALDESAKHWDTILIFLLSSKLDKATKREWENYIKNENKNNTFHTTKQFTDFLTERCQFLESLEVSTSLSVPVENNKKAIVSKSFAHVSTNQSSCPLCKQTHYLYRCDKFLEMSPSSRLSEVRKLNLCTNCLRSGHGKTECRSSACRKCFKKHNSLLHFDLHSNHSHSNSPPARSSLSGTSRTAQSQINSASTNTQAQGAQNIELQPQNQGTGGVQTQSHCSTSTHCNQLTSATVLLSTAMVQVNDQNGRPVTCRCLLDNGSQSNFISERLFSRLGLKQTNINLPVSGINQSLTRITKSTIAHVSSLNSSFAADLNFLIINSITDVTPQKAISISHLKIPKTLELADPKFYEPSAIDMLLGASIFYEILSIGQIKLGTGQPILHRTKLGWIVSGDIIEPISSRQVSCFLSKTQELHNKLEDFWCIEELPQPVYTSEQKECELHFSTTTIKDESGRFCVSLPFKQNVDKLGESRDQATERLYSLERRLGKNSNLKQEYHEFMREYLLLGHMTEIPLDQITQSPHYYLPHHCVEKQSSSTTRVRVVFDASSKTTTGLSLNDVLKTGPVVQNDLFSILARFRTHNIVLTADISKMYRQININQSQHDMQRIVWRFDPNEAIRHFHLRTVTYGTSSASFLATRCLLQIAIDNSQLYPDESEIIKTDFYVDDLLTGAEDQESLVKIKSNIEKLLSQSGFQLRKFMSSDSHILSHINEARNISHYVIQSEQSTKTLGILWNSKTDSFIFTSVEHQPATITKRTILSSISQVFDPLGLLQPIIVGGKLILQKLWLTKADWDEQIPSPLKESFLLFLTQLKNVTSFKIPRHVILRNSIFVDIHGFCDSSQAAYGCCIYLVSQDTFGNKKSALLCAKSRVAPLKVLSIPRLELCGALLLSRLINKVTDALKININHIYCWTDSTIVLSWLSAESSDFKVFVSNRISEIQQNSVSFKWLHVPSHLNPADILSRATDISEANKAHFWWHGPDYLIQNQDLWPQQPDLIDQNTDKTERKLNANICLISTFSHDFINKYSSFSKMQRIFAHCLRFINNSRLSPQQRNLSILTIEEINAATINIIKLVQAESFNSDIQSIKQSQQVKSSSTLSSLNPFLDHQGVLRVGGRLVHSNLTYSQKYPILLPKKHHLTTLIITHEHIRNLHSGVQGTLSFVRQQFWPINGKIEVKRVIKSCVTCFKARPTSITQKMGNLPFFRVQPSRVFASCGIDYAGPFPLKDGNTRNRKIIKSYVCIFVCLLSKAVHVELVTSLTTESFLDAFKRFTSRRGLCKDIYSDNATNFTRAEKELHKLFSSRSQEPKFSHYLADCQIQWHFIPPRSPHFGGIWETAVKSLKLHLHRVTNNTKLNYEQFSTLLCQIEAVLNSRPILPLSNDPNDLQALTPGHFLIGSAMNMLPQPHMLGDKQASVSQYHHIQLMFCHFWNRWNKEYLHTLQQRTKWKLVKQTTSLIGALVLLKEDNTPPSYWHLGRITQIHPGSDGIVRVVSVKTKHGVLKRAVTKICVIPCNDTQ